MSPSASTSSSQVSAERTRGRPKGKNRVPLTADQRRERNAGYERQRRQEQQAAMAALAAAAGCDPNTPAAALLAAVIRQIKIARTKERIDDLVQSCGDIKAEIAELQRASQSTAAERQPP